MHICTGLIHELMPGPGCDFKTLSFFKHQLMIFEPHRALPVQDKKELPRRIVMMHHLGSSRRDALLDYAHIAALEQVPASTVPAPDVMFAVLNGNNHGPNTSTCEKRTDFRDFSILAQIF
jgi:hypothetical protein